VVAQQWIAPGIFRIFENNLKITVFGSFFCADSKKAKISQFGACSMKLSP